MPAENTATGTQHIVASGNTIFTPIALQTKRGLEAMLQQIVDYQYAFQEPGETFAYLEGDDQMIASLNFENIKDLEMNVRLTLTNLKQTENLQKNQMAINFFGKFLAIPAPFQPIAAPLFSNVFKNLGIDNANDYFEPIVKVSQQIAQDSSPQNKISESVAFKDLPEWAKLQMLASLGMQVPPEAMQAAVAQISQQSLPSNEQSSDEPKHRKDGGNSGAASHSEVSPEGGERGLGSAPPNAA